MGQRMNQILEGSVIFVMMTMMIISASTHFSQKC